MKIAKPIALLIEAFEKLPGVGPKTAQRLAFYLLHVPNSQLQEFAEALSDLKKNTKLCSVCKNVGEEDPCLICSDKARDRSIILVVEQPLDLIAFEKIGRYKGLYHCLHGSISPLDNIGPDELYVDDLIRRVKDKALKEIIIATNPTMEGEATAMYLVKKIKGENSKVKVTRLGMGIPTGADLEYADEVTLTRAIEGRREI
jgi:recombination protein RecR